MASQTQEQIEAGLKRWSVGQVAMIKKAIDSGRFKTPGEQYEFGCMCLGPVMKLGATREQAVKALLDAGYDLDSVLK
jgi:hypothetical protein